jgi:hypothetical protein
MDMIFLRVMIGNQDYHFAEDLDSELIACSHGVQSIASAMMGAVEQMLYQVAEEVMRKRLACGCSMGGAKNETIEGG